MNPIQLFELASRQAEWLSVRQQVVATNIANANTPGYSRQSVELATAGSAYNGSGYFGRGVTVSTVTRAANMFLSQQAVATGQQADQQLLDHVLLADDGLADGGAQRREAGELLLQVGVGRGQVHSVSLGVRPSARTSRC